MGARYGGPLRDEPISIELHNTLYATPEGGVDGLADEPSRLAFLDDIAPRIHSSRLPSANPPDAVQLLELRHVVRAALHASVDAQPHDTSAIETLNRFAARAPTSIRAELAADADGPPLATLDHHGASSPDITLAAFAADAIALISGPRRADLRACRAPGCVLIYVKDDPRQRWCSNACGNRARQARHYLRSRSAT